MSRIQQILEKAERDGAALRTSRLGATLPGPGIPLDQSEPVIPVARPFAASAPPPISPIVPDDEDGVARYSPQLQHVLVAGVSPQSYAAEQFRALRTRLARTEGATSRRTFLVTSPQKGEGKSMTAGNLALTMAQELQRRVVIVEADLRRPSLHHLFGVPGEPGLAEYLVGAAELREVMRVLPEHNLTLIPAGGIPANPAELIGSSAMRRLLEQLRTRFDRVILDTPPVLPLADVAILAPLVDGVLMVVRAGITPRPAIDNALRSFDASKLVGVVLNESGGAEVYQYATPRA